MNPKTNEQLVQKFNILNKKYFGGELKVDEIKFSSRKSSRTLGRCFYNRGTKRCSVEINPLLKGKDITETLVHEMCHVSNIMEYGYSNHQEIFKKEARRIYALSKGKINVDTHCTDKVLSETLAVYRDEQKIKRLAKEANMTVKAYKKLLKEFANQKI